MTLVCEADMLLQGMVGGWAVIEASHTVSSGLNVTCHMLNDIRYFWPKKHAFWTLICGAAIFRRSFLEF